MTLVEELRKVDPGKPGHWSARVSVLLACVLFVLVAALGMQVRVRGQTLPQLENAGAALPELRQRLESARVARDRLDLLRSDVDRLKERLQQFGGRIPAGPDTLDLAVALTTAYDASRIREVRPWRPLREMSRPLPYIGGEIEVAAGYREIVQFLQFVLAEGPLRELTEIVVEPRAETDAGGLRATVRMLAYFRNDGYAEVLESAAAPDPPPAPIDPIDPPHTDLRSPFGGAAGNTAHAVAAETTEAEPRERQAGHIRVGGRRYELVEDPGGSIRLEQVGP